MGERERERKRERERESVCVCHIYYDRDTVMGRNIIDRRQLGRIN